MVHKRDYAGAPVYHASHASHSSHSSHSGFHLLLLPTEIVGLIVQNFAYDFVTQRALALACRGLHAMVDELDIRRLWVQTRQLFGNRLRVPHYTSDIAHIQDVLTLPRFRRLRRLVLSVDAPALLAGGRGRARLQTLQAQMQNQMQNQSQNQPHARRDIRRGRVRSLLLGQIRHLVIEHTLSSQLGGRLPLSAPGIGQLVELTPNLLTLRVSDVPNLGAAFFRAVRNARGLRTLLLSRCGLTPAFARSLGTGAIDGCFLPPDITALKLDVANLEIAIHMAIRQPDPPLLLSRMTNLTLLELGASAQPLGVDVWYALRCLNTIGARLLRFQSRCAHVCSLFEFAQNMLEKEGGAFTITQLPSETL